MPKLHPLVTFGEGQPRTGTLSAYLVGERRLAPSAAFGVPKKSTLSSGYGTLRGAH